VDTLAAYSTALGLSTAAGLNAYVPMLAVGLFQRYTDLVTLPAPFDRLGDPLVLGTLAVIATLDFVGDKIPIVDHVLHAAGIAVATMAARRAADPGARSEEPLLIARVGRVASLRWPLAPAPRRDPGGRVRRG
jgi:hypothetical protein